MRYLILGGTGFIGRNLITSLLQKPENMVISFSRSIPSKGMTEQIKYKQNLSIINGDFKKIDFESITKNIDVVVHLISTTNPSNANYQIDMTENVLPTLQLLKACVKNSIKKFVFVSSGGTVYGRTDEVFINEEHPTNPICSYGIQKLIIEKYILLYYENHGLDYSIIRVSNPYGKYQEIASGVGAVSNFTLKSLNSEPITIYGDGKITRDYIYIDDVIKGINNIINSENATGIFNLGTGIATSLNEIIEILSEIVGNDIDVKYKNARSMDVDYNVLDIEKYSKIFNEHKMINLREGIILLINYYRESSS